MLNSEGYSIVKGVLSSEDCDSLAQSFIQESLKTVFVSRGFPLDVSDERNLQLFTDPALRRKKFGEKGFSSVWKNGNSRKPYLSKNCGMIEHHFNLEMLRKVTFNEKLYEAAANVYETPFLVHKEGPERYSIKAKGSTDMPKHMDMNLFYDSLNHRTRIQSLVCLKVGDDVKPRDSGTLCLYINFHHYFDFARELFHPERGLVPFPDLKSRFFVFPKNWRKKYEPALLKYAKEYTIFLQNGEKSQNAYFSKLQKLGIKVPNEMLPLEWKPIVLEPGDLVFWSQKIPHFSLRNKSNVPRIVSYFSLFPVSKDWFGSKENSWVRYQFQKGVFYQSGRFTICNPEEHNYLIKSKKIKDVRALCNSNKLSRKLCGEENWFEPILSFSERYWDFVPKLLPKDCFTLLYSEIIDLCVLGNGSRLSCVFSDTAFETFYGKLPNYSWKKSKTLSEIKKCVKIHFGMDAEYCLAHIYRNGKDSISWHNDKEALDSRIVSFSLGAPRKFRLKKMGRRQGWDHEFTMKSGDCIFMKKGCQRAWLHCVPKELRIKNPRINLTFRE